MVEDWTFLTSADAITFQEVRIKENYILSKFFRLNVARTLKAENLILSYELSCLSLDRIMDLRKLDSRRQAAMPEHG